MLVTVQLVHFSKDRATKVLPSLTSRYSTRELVKMVAHAQSFQGTCLVKRLYVCHRSVGSVLVSTN